MLVLTRKRGEQIVIDGRIVVTLLDTQDGRARLGIEAPQEIPVHREEVHQAIMKSREPSRRPKPLSSPGQTDLKPAPAHQAATGSGPSEWLH